MKLNLVGLTALLVSNLVGSGALFLPKELAEFGGYAFIGWILSAIGAFSLGYLFVSLQQRIPEAKGLHDFIGEAFSLSYESMRRIKIWILWSWVLGASIGNATFAVALFRICTTNSLILLVLYTLLIYMIYKLNCFNLHTTQKLEVLLTVFKLILLIVLPAICTIFAIQSRQNIEYSNLSVSSGVIKSMYLTLWGFVGIETALLPPDCVENSTQNIPKALIFGITICFVVYILGLWAMMKLIPIEKLKNSTSPYTDLLVSIVPIEYSGIATAIGYFLISILYVASLNSWTMTTGIFMSEQKNLFPKFFNARNENNSPYLALAISCSITFITLCISLFAENSYQFIVNMATNIALWIYLVSIFAWIILVREIISFKFIIFLIALSYVMLCLFSVEVRELILSLLLFCSGEIIVQWKKRELRE